MVPSKTTSTTACKLCMVCVANSLKKQDGYRGKTRYALVERNYVIFYLIIGFRERSQDRFELLNEIF